MQTLQRRFLVLVFCLALVGAAFWATSTVSAGPERSGEFLPKAGDIVFCEVCDEDHEIQFTNFGTLKEIPFPGAESNKILAEVGKEFVSKSGLRTVPIYIRSLSGRGFVEGVGETRFWLDPTRPATSALWEKVPGQRFPAVQEMRFHFFYTTEAFPGKIFRSVNVAIMHTDNLFAFPPRPNTHYHLAAPVELEDVSEPGVVVGRVMANQAVVVPHKPSPRVQEREGG
jgi:hypothetical protein